jgi:hypothetical protein
VGTGTGAGAGGSFTGGAVNAPGVVGQGTNAGAGGSFTGGSTGDGVLGVAGGGAAGVHGQSTSSNGVAVLAENFAGGPALEVVGRAAFSNSGVVTIPSGATQATVPVGGLTGSSIALACMQNIAGAVAVKACVLDDSSGNLTIVLTKAPASPATATVAWFIVN